MPQKSITMYYRPLCGFCSSAEHLLRSKGYVISKINIWEVAGAKEEMVQRSGGRTTVPQIFADNDYIGDCNKLHDLERNGELEASLNL